MNARQVLSAAQALGGTGLFRPVRPVEYLRMAELFRRWGTSPAAASAIAALRAPRQAAVADDMGGLSWREVDDAANAVARALRDEGVSPGSVVGLMGRNHRYFVEAALAVSKLGAHLVLLNTDSGPHQLGEVLRRERVATAVFDQEFATAFETARFEGVSFGQEAVREAARRGHCPPPEPPRRPGRVVIMTSGTTGVPKGAQRKTIAPPVDTVVSAFSKLPMRVREPVVVSPPLFHALGFGFLGFALLLQGTLVVRNKFDPEALLDAVERHRATTLVAVPVMLQRILALPEAVRSRYDTSSLRMIVCSGSSLGAGLATAVMDTFGDILYDLYGSTETGWVTMAEPSDLRSAPGTVGRPPRGTRVAVLDDEGRSVPLGQAGRIFVSSGMTFDGYTGGGGKQVLAGMMSTGDTGYLDEAGRLFVEGRDDDMIVSGGENVFPEEVEVLLQNHQGLLDAAVVGVDDPAMGQRLDAFVVVRPGTSVSADDIRGYVRAHLARYKVPRHVAFVDRIPRNAMGKVLRNRLHDGDGCDAATSAD